MENEVNMSEPIPGGRRSKFNYEEPFAFSGVSVLTPAKRRFELVQVIWTGYEQTLEETPNIAKSKEKSL